MRSKSWKVAERTIASVQRKVRRERVIHPSIHMRFLSARKRSKELVAHLQTQVEELTKDKAELKRENDVMKAQLELLENQNKALMMNQIVQQQQQPQHQPAQVGYSGFPSLNNFLPGNHLLNASNSLVSSSTTSSTSNSATMQPKLAQPPPNNITSTDLTNLIARLTQNQQQLPPPPTHAMGDNGQLAALLGLTSLLQAQNNDANKNLPKH